MSTDPSDRASIEREIRARQLHLATTVDELAARVTPKAIAASTVATLRGRALHLTESLKQRAGGAATTARGRAVGAATTVRGAVARPAPVSPAVPAPAIEARPRAGVAAHRAGPVDPSRDGAVKLGGAATAGSVLVALVGALIWRRNR